MNTRKATKADLPQLSQLFDGYRQFYDQASDLALAESFLLARFEQNESVIFVAEAEQVLMGFTQLYPTFSSVSAQRVWILNDLYVSAEHRRLGVGEALMNAARKYAEETGAKGVTLETGVNNTGAQKLYEQLGYLREDDVYHYFLATKGDLKS